MSIDTVDGFGMLCFALTPGPSPTGAGEGSVELHFEALHSDQWLHSTKCSVRPLTPLVDGELPSPPVSPPSMTARERAFLPQDA